MKLVTEWLRALTFAGVSANARGLRSAPRLLASPSPLDSNTTTGTSRTGLKPRQLRDIKREKNSERSFALVVLITVCV